MQASKQTIHPPRNKQQRRHVGVSRGSSPRYDSRQLSSSTCRMMMPAPRLDATTINQTAMRRHATSRSTMLRFRTHTRSTDTGATGLHRREKSRTIHGKLIPSIITPEDQRHHQLPRAITCAAFAGTILFRRWHPPRLPLRQQACQR